MRHPIGWVIDGRTAAARALKRLYRLLTTLHIKIYRLTGGRLGHRLSGRRKVLLLTTTGRKSGLPRTVPLVYDRIDGACYLGAGSAGSQRHPDWFLNLRDNPDVQIQIEQKSALVHAEILEGKQRERIWQELVKRNNPVVKYQALVSRNVPIIRLVLNDYRQPH